jgi:hypothetical protein
LTTIYKYKTIFYNTILTKTFDEDENYPKLVKYCNKEGLKIGKMINAGIAMYLQTMDVKLAK